MVNKEEKRGDAKGEKKKKSRDQEKGSKKQKEKINMQNRYYVKEL